MPVMLGLKTVECRTWQTAHRGELLICSSSRKTDGCVCGHALATVELVGIEPFTEAHLWDALMEPEDMQQGAYAWLLEHVEVVEPFPVKGKLHLFDVDDSLVKRLGEPSRETVERHVMPLVYRSKDSEADEIWADTCAMLGW